MPLTEKQERLAEAVLSGLSITDAFLQAGYAPPKARDTLSSRASEAVNKPAVQKRIAELRQARARKTDASKEKMILEALKTLEMSQTVTERVSSIRLIADLQGYIVRKQEVTGTVTHVTQALASLSDTELRHMLQAPDTNTIDAEYTEVS